MDISNASRFLHSYNRIEAQLKLIHGVKAAMNFTDLVKKCSDVDITVRRYATELIDYGKLRNAIVHRSAGSACVQPFSVRSRSTTCPIVTL